MSARAAIVLETWNLAATLERTQRPGMGCDPTRIAVPLERQLARLAPQLAGTDHELVVTHAGLTTSERTRLAARFDRRTQPIRFVLVPRSASYYEHKTLGFHATSAAAVAFLDGDTAPVPGWLAAITGPILDGSARVVAGATSYAGFFGRAANALDFPYFTPSHRRFAARPAEEPQPAAAAVQNLMSNNIAFARDVYAAHGFPAIPSMFHGQCQILALRLGKAGIALQFAPRAHVTHEWPEDLEQWLAVRLLKGADTASLLPYVAEAHVPALTTVVERLGGLPAVALLGARAVLGIPAALRTGRPVRALGLLAAITVVDTIGALARRRVYAAYGLARSGPGASQSGHFCVTVAASQDSHANATTWCPASPNSASAWGLGDAPAA